MTGRERPLIPTLFPSPFNNKRLTDFGFDSVSRPFGAGSFF